MSFKKAKEYLESKSLAERILEFDISSATVKEAAVALGVTEGEIAKTLSFLVDGKPILVITSGDVKIDNAKYKAQFNTKAKMIPFEDVEALIGHQVGGVCPFGINEGIPVFLDESLKKYEIIYPACGSSNSAVKLSIEELVEISNMEKWISVSKEC